MILFTKANVILLKFITAVILICCNALCLECLFFKVGQANFVAIKNLDHTLIVDCGKKLDLGTIKTNQQFVKLVSRLIRNDHMSLIITHQHDDHYGLIQKLKLELKQDFETVLIGGSKPPNMPVQFQDLGSKFCNVEVNGQITNSDDINIGRLQKMSVEKLLGHGVTIELLLPNQSVGTEDHDQNLVVKITYAGRSILLPGDASANLWLSLLNENRDKLKNIDIFLAPHHGSNTYGQLLSFYTINPELFIISSDPNKRENLPRQDVSLLVFSQTANFEYVARHNTSFWTGLKTEQIQVQTPIFTTCNAASAYYKVTITPNGTITLQDEEGLQKFASFKSAEQKVQLSEIFKELRKYTDSDTTYMNFLLSKLRSLIKDGSLSLKDIVFCLNISNDSPDNEKFAKFLFSVSNTQSPTIAETKTLLSLLYVFDKFYAHNTNMIEFLVREIKYSNSVYINSAIKELELIGYVDLTKIATKYKLVVSKLPNQLHSLFHQIL